LFAKLFYSIPSLTEFDRVCDGGVQEIIPPAAPLNGERNCSWGSNSGARIATGRRLLYTRPLGYYYGAFKAGRGINGEEALAVSIN